MEEAVSAELADEELDDVSGGGDDPTAINAGQMDPKPSPGIAANPAHEQSNMESGQMNQGGNIGQPGNGLPIEQWS